MIKATEKFPGGGGIWSPGMDLWWGIWTAFRPREGGIWTKILQKIQMPAGCPGGDVEASIWLVHYGNYKWFVSLFCVENYGIEAASCLANFLGVSKWNINFEILMLIGWGWSYGTARKTNDYATKIHFMWLESTLFVSSCCYFSIMAAEGHAEQKYAGQFVQCKYKIAAS